MKFKTERTKVPGTYTREGKTVPVVRTKEVRVPSLPRDWQTTALYGAVGIVGALTLLSIAWSTYAIGDTLDGGIGYVVAVIFDIGWAAALLLEYLARYDERKRQFPQRLGWVLLAVTMGAIAYHGINQDPPNYGMAIVGAFVSFFAKVLWHAVMEHVNADLSDEDKQWLASEISTSQTKAAIATVRRQTARTEQRAALELLAMEKERREVTEAFGFETPDAIVHLADVKAPAIGSPTLADLGKAGAVRFALNELPDASPEEIAEVLQNEGVDIDLAYVRQVIRTRTKPEPEIEAEIIELRK